MSQIIFGSRLDGDAMAFYKVVIFLDHDDVDPETALDKVLNDVFRAHASALHPTHVVNVEDLDDMSFVSTPGTEKMFPGIFTPSSLQTWANEEIDRLRNPPWPQPGSYLADNLSEEQLRADYEDTVESNKETIAEIEAAMRWLRNHDLRRLHIDRSNH